MKLKGEIVKNLAVFLATIALCMLCSLSGCSSSAQKVALAQVEVYGGDAFWRAYESRLDKAFDEVIDLQRKEQPVEEKADVFPALLVPAIAEGVKLLLKQAAEELDERAEDYRLRFAGDVTLVETGDAVGVGSVSGKIAKSFHDTFHAAEPGWIGGIIVTRSDVKDSRADPNTVIVYGVRRISAKGLPAVYEIVPLCYYAKQHAAKRIGRKRTLEADLKLDFRQTTPSMWGRGPITQPLVSLTTRVAKFEQSVVELEQSGAKVIVPKPVFFSLNLPSGEQTQDSNGRVYHSRSYRLFASEPFFAPPKWSAVRIGFAADERDAGKTRKILKGLGKALDNNAGKIGDAVGDLAKPSEGDTSASTNG